MKITTATRIAAFAAAILAFAGCAGTMPSGGTPANTDNLSIRNAWVKASNDGMSAAFGTLENDGDIDLVVTDAWTTASTKMQLHDMVEDEFGGMAMRESGAGFTIPARGVFELYPGGSHLMLMGLTAPIIAGTEVKLVLTLGDGSTYEFTAPAKNYTGANENYAAGNVDTDIGLSRPTDTADMEKR